MVTPDCRQDAEEHFGRRPVPAGREKETNWRQSRSFLSKLACLTEEAEPAALEAHSAAVHHKYTITGYQGSGDGLQAMVLVKVADGHETLLSLEPEIVGRVLGLPFEGLEVPDALNSDDKERIIVPKADWKNRKTHGGFNLNSIDHPGLRDYIEKRQGQVFGQTQRGVSFVELFCFQEEFFRDSQYNWAEKRIKNVRRQLVARRKPLSIPVQDLLISYFDCALPSVLSFAAKRLEKLQAGSGRRMKQHNHVRKGLEEEFEKQRTDYGSGRQHEEVETPRRSKRLREQAEEQHVKPDHLDHTGAKETSRERDPSRCENAGARKPAGARKAAGAWACSPQLSVEDELLLRFMNVTERLVHVWERALRR